MTCSLPGTIVGIEGAVMNRVKRIFHGACIPVWQTESKKSKCINKYHNVAHDKCYEENMADAVKQNCEVLKKCPSPSPSQYMTFTPTTVRNVFAWS